MDFDIKRVRSLRFWLGSIEYAIFAVLFAYIVFCGYFIFVSTSGFDYLLGLAAFLIFLYRLCHTDMKNYDHLPLVDQVNVLFRRDEIHVRKPTETEREIALSFFEGKDLEMPTLLTCDSPERLNAFALRFNNKQLLVVSELSYWYLSLYDIWAVFGHEMGHVLHYDLYRLQIEKWMFEIGAWFSVLAIFKFVVYVLISPFLIVYSWWVCLLLAASIYGYRRYALPVLPSYLYLIREVLADNTSAQKNKSAMQMLTCLRTINEEVEYPDFTLREHALLWICHKENDPS